jgi:hypothetical protein
VSEPGHGHSGSHVPSGECCSNSFLGLTFSLTCVDYAALIEDEIGKEIPLRPLTSLKWPYVAEESAYPDPLKRDDPKPLQMRQYEAIGSRTCPVFFDDVNVLYVATSPDVRAALEGHPGLKELLRSIDRLRGPAREEALQVSLGVSRDAKDAEQIHRFGGVKISEEDRRAMRELAEASEAAVRGNREAILGLDWSD